MSTDDDDDRMQRLLGTQEDIDREDEDDQDYDMRSEDGHHGADPLQLEPEELTNLVPANDINNSNNASRTFKWTPIESVQENTTRDGYTYAFMSLAEGPMLSTKAKEQIMVLNYILETPPSRRRVLNTDSLVATFDSDNQFETLTERIRLEHNEMDIMQGGRDICESMRVDAIPLDQVDTPLRINTPKAQW
jgi:hypothetical protein